MTKHNQRRWDRVRDAQAEVIRVHDKLVTLTQDSPDLSETLEWLSRALCERKAAEADWAKHGHAETGEMCDD